MLYNGGWTSSAGAFCVENGVWTSWKSFWCGQTASGRAVQKKAGGSKEKEEELESRGCTEVRGVEPSSFVVIRALASESALSAAGPCV